LVIHQNIKDGFCIRLLPNRSASWKQTKYFVLGISVLSLSIATFWALQGAWVILPFAGLEVALLCILAHRVSYRTYHQQLLRVDDASVKIEWGYYYPKKSWLFERADSEFIITHPEHSLSPACVEIVQADQALRLGVFLNKEDIDALVELIRNSGLRYRFKGSVKTVALDKFD